jgi:hypothetical protein
MTDLAAIGIALVFLLAVVALWFLVPAVGDE